MLDVLALLVALTPLPQTTAARDGLDEPFAHARHACGSELSPETIARIAERLAEGGATASPSLDRGQTFVVPVTVHVVRRSNGTGGLGPAGVNGSLLRANADFASAGIEFCQVGPTLFVDEDDYYDCVCGSETSSLRATQRVEDTVNLYFAPNLAIDGAPLCGLATFPGTGNSGVIVSNSCAGAGEPTLTHELGHFFDLLHTHDRTFGRECADGTNCDVAGDLVCDTPADPGLINRVNASCGYTGPTGPNCSGGTGALSPDTTNYMSYAPHRCLDHFTAGQIARMRAALLEERPELARTSCPPADFPPTPALVRVSVTPEGEPSLPSSQPAVAAGGRFVAFVSAAEELLPADVEGNGVPQVFVRDLATGTVELVSRGFDGRVANGICDSPKLSADGRHVAYSCSARNLVPGVVNIGTNVLHHDRWTGRTTLVTPGMDGGGANRFASVPLDLSDDGKVIAFESPSTNLLDVGPFATDRIYVADLGLGTLELVSRSSTGEPALARCFEPALSADGRVVAFASSADNLHPDAPDGATHVFVHDRASGKTEVASVGPDGRRYPGAARSPALSGDGGRVAFVWAAAGNWPGDRTGVAVGDVVVKDRETGRFLLASADADGAQSAHGGDSPSLSADGTVVAFRSEANEFYGLPTVLVDQDVWLKDLERGVLRLASPGGAGSDSLGAATTVDMDARGRVVVFGSLASNLVPGDLNAVEDVFAYGKHEVVAGGRPSAGASLGSR